VTQARSPKGFSEQRRIHAPAIARRRGGRGGGHLICDQRIDLDDLLILLANFGERLGSGTPQ